MWCRCDGRAERPGIALRRSSRSVVGIIATGVFGGIGGIGPGCSGGGGAGLGGVGVGDGGRGSAASPEFRLGAIIAFSTFAEPQTGHVTSLRLACLS